MQLILAVVSLLTGEKWTIPAQTRTWAAYVYLVVIVTVVAFFLYMYVLSKWTASTTSYGFVLNPLVVTIVVASSLAGEKITPDFLVGACNGAGWRVGRSSAALQSQSPGSRRMQGPFRAGLAALHLNSPNGDSGMKNSIRRHPLIWFFGMAFLFSWIVVLPRILNPALPVEPFQILGGLACLPLSFDDGVHGHPKEQQDRHFIQQTTHICVLRAGCSDRQPHVR